MELIQRYGSTQNQLFEPQTRLGVASYTFYSGYGIFLKYSKSTWFLFPTAIGVILYTIVYSLLSECPVTCDLGLSYVYLGLAKSRFGLTLPIFPTIIFYLCFNLCLTLCFTYFTYVLTYVKLCLTYASTRHMKLTCLYFIRTKKNLGSPPWNVLEASLRSSSV